MKTISVAQISDVILNLRRPDAPSLLVRRFLDNNQRHFNFMGQHGFFCLCAGLPRFWQITNRWKERDSGSPVVPWLLCSFIRRLHIAQSHVNFIHVNLIAVALNEEKNLSTVEGVEERLLDVRNIQD